MVQVTARSIVFLQGRPLRLKNIVRVVSGIQIRTRKTRLVGGRGIPVDAVGVEFEWFQISMQLSELSVHTET